MFGLSSLSCEDIKTSAKQHALPWKSKGHTTSSFFQIDLTEFNKTLRKESLNLCDMWSLYYYGKGKTCGCMYCSVYAYRSWTDGKGVRSQRLIYCRRPMWQWFVIFLGTYTAHFVFICFLTHSSINLFSSNWWFE